MARKPSADPVERFNICLPLSMRQAMDLRRHRLSPTPGRSRFYQQLTEAELARPLPEPRPETTQENK